MNNPFALYIHYPFCLSKCPYCDFNSHVQKDIDHDAWQKALIKQMQFFAGRVQHRPLTSIFFGGGTPSLMPAEMVGGLIENAEKLFGFAEHCEITLEANPTSSEAKKFKAYSDAGVNRLSMGIQALNDADLRALGRTHSAAEALKAFDSARGVFDRVSFDLIYARMKQNLQDWEKELTLALGYAVDHLSLYQLTIEEGTRFEAWYKAGKLPMPSDDVAVEFYELTENIMNQHGFDSYEVSNYAPKGKECQHNLTYWNYYDYIGVGPGSHGRVRIDDKFYATDCVKSPQSYLQGMNNDILGITHFAELTKNEQAIEYILMSMRLKTGTNIQRLQDDFGYILPNLSALQEQGLIFIDNGFIIATPAGRLVLNGIIEKMV